jgi:hypothetical protein
VFDLRRIALTGAAAALSLSASAQDRPVAPARADSGARAPAPPPISASALLDRARAARQRVDSAIRSYDAIARERFTLGLAIRDAGRERTLVREESAGRVQWTADRGVRLELLGRRRASNGMFGSGSSGSNDNAVPIPYFPGKEPLWLVGNSSFVSTNTTNDRSEVHPLEAGAEAFYNFSLGDSITIGLPDGTRILLRELRATPKKTSWRVLSASLWLDDRTAQLVRAAFRYSAPVDIWQQARTARDPANRPPRLLALMASPLKATMEAVTVESGLYEGQFWLPRIQVADMRVDAPSQSTATVRLEQRFEYESVNAVLDMGPPLPPATLALKAKADSLWAVDSTFAAVRDSALVRARSKRDTVQAFAAYRAWEDSSWKKVRTELTALRNEQCKATGTYTRYRTRYGRRLATEVYVPCDSVKLATAPVFQGELMGQNEAVWGSPNRAGLVAALSELPAAEWTPQPIRFGTSLDQFRYNRIEGASLAGTAEQELGNGTRWAAQLRGSAADRQVNGELFLERTGYRRTLRAGGYRRLVQADDYGAAFALGASIQNLFSGLDEQFYYRAAGAEITGQRRGEVGGGALTWRAFGEYQSQADPRARFTVQSLWRDSARFGANVVDTLRARDGAWAGGSLRWRAIRGDDATGWRVSTDSRVEAATGATTFGRAATDLTLERRLPLRLRATLSGSIGSSAGEMPVQRGWNIGGWQTVRGIIAGAQRGNTFWLGRGELQWDGLRRFQPVVFTDLGWAGDRRQFATSPRHLRSAGGGVAFFRGLFRFDAARSLEPGARWRVDSYAVARF